MSSIIQIWVDLGTTNSAVAVNNNGTYEIVKNSDQLTYTPSVVGVNKWKNIQVWKKAYENLFLFTSEENIVNYKAEIKRLMWTKEKIYFERTGTYLSPEEISAEILKYLKMSVTKKYPEINQAWVVITVPAYFDTIQKEATQKAWELAWFNEVVLIQEPIAGAIAYGFDNAKDENWLVYDLGWGTFDVAVISNKSWVLTVKWHAWDNFLWGKDIDRLIVEKIILPQLKSINYGTEIENLDTWVSNVLKYYAEEAKKELSDVERTTIIIDNPLILDKEWEQIYLEIEIERSTLEELILPIIKKTSKLCQKAIDESWFQPKNIDRVILIWGPTQIPIVKETLEKELQINVDISTDPLTTVAKWACIYGSSQIIKWNEPTHNETQDESKDKYDIELHYEPTVADSETLVTWKVKWIQEWEYFIEIQSLDKQFHSDRLKLKNWKFFTKLYVPNNKTTTYKIFLSNSDWSIIPVNNDTFSITHWISIAGTPISHSISIALNNKSFMWKEDWEYCEILFDKGSLLPLEKKVKYRTTRDLQKGTKENALPIKLYEGESSKPDRNKQICTLLITWEDIPYNLPQWTEVDVTISLDKSNKLILEVYFPDIDLYKSWESIRTTWEQENIDLEILNSELSEQKERSQDIAEHLSDEERKSVEDDIRDLSANAKLTDPDSMRRSHHNLRELKKRLDQLEYRTLSKKLINEFESSLVEAKEIINSDSDELNQLSILEQSWREAIEQKKRERLQTVIESLKSLIFSHVLNTREWLIWLFQHLYENRNLSKDPVEMNKLFEQAKEALDKNDISTAKICLQQMFNLLPEWTSENLSSISWISK